MAYRVAELCSQHTQAPWHPELRRTAYSCLLRLTAEASGLDAAINLGLDAVEAETSPVVK